MLGCGAAKPAQTAEAPLGEEITIGHVTWPVGGVRMHTERLSVFLEIPAEGKKTPLGMTQEQILEAREEVAPKEWLRVTFADKRERTIVDGHVTAEKPSALIGRTFLIGIFGDKAKALDENEKPCEDAECIEAAKGYQPAKKKGGASGSSAASSPKPDALHRPMRVGQRVDELAEDLVGAGSMETSDATVTLDHLEGAGAARVAVFVYSLTVKDTSETGKLVAKIKGDVRVVITTGRRVSTTGKGPLEMELPTETGKVTMRGTLSLREGYDYR